MHSKHVHIHEDKHHNPSTGQNPYGTPHKKEESKLYTNGAAKSNGLIILRYKKS